MHRKRFIDFASHVGCSNKLGATELSKLLEHLWPQDLSTSGQSVWADYGSYALDDCVIVSNVDIILPMVTSPTDFGKIVTAHALSDLYTAGARPLFALNILGIPTGLDISSGELGAMLLAGKTALEDSGASLLGGHTLCDQTDLFYGMAVVGIANKDSLITNAGAKVGDALVLTKALGTSIASINWKEDPTKVDDFRDVLEGMVATNKIAGGELSNSGVSAATDVTGFGFLGHLHNLLLSSRVSAEIWTDKLPVYGSIRKLIDNTHPTKIWRSNFDYVLPFVEFHGVRFSPFLENILFDSQVSGGLVVTLPPHNAASFIDKLTAQGVQATIIGEIIDGQPGSIRLL